MNQRTVSADAPPEVARHRLEAQRAQAEADIADVQAQMDAGELDAATATELIDRYRHEIASASLALGTLEDASADPVSRRRSWIGATLLIAAFAFAGFLAAQAIEPRQAGSFITGGPVQTGPVDLEEVTNEQMEAVIAANPDVPEVAQMRVALANRYFEEGDFSSALDHYLTGLTGALNPGQRAQALGRVGWMTFVSGQTDLAKQYVTEALATEPEYLEGTFFLALIELYGNADAAAARPLLEQLAARDDLPDEIRSQVERALDDATSASGGSS